MAADGSVIIQIDGDDSGFEKTLKGLKSAAGGAVKGLAAGAAAATAGVAALGKAALDSYASYEQLVGGVDTLFKESSAAVQEYAANAYKTAGLSANEYMSSITAFSASLLQNLGGDTQAAAQLANQAVVDMADNANKMGTSMESIVETYQSLARGNYEMLDNLKLGYGGTKAELERLVEDAEKLTGQALDPGKFSDIITAIHAVQTEMGITGTTALEASTTIEGSVAAMVSAWKNLLTGIADDNADLGALVDGFVASVETAADNILPRLQVIFSGIGDLIAALAPKIAQAVPALLGDVLPGLAQAAGQMLTAFGGALVQNLPLLLSSATALVTGFLGYLQTNLPQITAAAGQIVQAIGTALLTAAPQLLSAALAILQNIASGIAANLPTLLPAALSMLTEISGGLRSGVGQLVDGIINRSVTLEKLKELGAECPYNDLVEKHWSYCDLMEATIPHSAEEWHGLSYNDGIYNIIVEKFVEQNGAELAESITTAGKEEVSSKAIPAYEYRGYICMITYQYTNGDAIPSLEKTANVKTANAGDLLTYTVKLSNNKSASSAWKEVILTDELPDGLTFVDSSVYVDGKSAEHSFKDGVLSVVVGDIAAGQAVTVMFKVTVNRDMYNQTIYNTAVAEGTNGTCKDTDDGVYINKGDTASYVEKRADKASAKVGDKITYTLTLSNSETATVPVENAVVTDVIPAGLTFEYRSVMLDDSTTSNYTYDEASRLLTVNVGSIEPDTSRTVSFVATVNENAYNATIQNLVTLTSDNTGPVQDKDDGVIVSDGMTDLSIKKSVSAVTAKVGETLTYTVQVANGAGAEVNIRDVTLTDEIPDVLTFCGNVTVDGYSAVYQYDNGSHTLVVPLDAIAPGQIKTVCFDVLINSDAYGMTIENTAVASGSNVPDMEDTDDGVIIEDGTTDGHAGAKSANKTTARVGDTITYTITLENSSLATAEWTGATVTDVLPDGVTFTGIIQKNGQATTEYAYDSSSRTLTLTPYAISPDTQVVYTFDVTVDEGMQGKYIVNTAILTDGDDQTPLPDAGVQIDEGEADPIVTKSTSVTEADVGDTFCYEITVKNGDKATAPWRNVVAYDTLPAGVKLIGNVYLNGKVALHKLSGNALSVLVGDLAAGESVTVSFDVQVLDTVAGTTLQNSVEVAGDGGSGTATDDGVTVPEVPQNPNDTTSFYVTKDVDKTVVNVSKGSEDANKTATFTIVVGNNSDTTWESFVLKDTLDVCRGELYQSAFAASGVQIYDFVLYPNGSRFLPMKTACVLGQS